MDGKHSTSGENGMTIHARPYAGDADFELMRDLLRRVYTEYGPPTFAMPGDIDWWRCTTNTPREHEACRLWFDGDRLVGFAWPTPKEGNVALHPRFLHLAPEALAWIEEWAAATHPEGCTYESWSYTCEEANNALLAERGFARTGDFLQLHVYDLTGPLPTLRPLPEGYCIRHVADDSDIEPRVEVHRAAFAPSRMTVEKHRCVRAAPTYRAELDLVMVAPEGDFAAFTIVWYDEAMRMGIFEPVGCHPGHQRKGLAGAVMVEGMRRLRVLGATRAHVNSWRDDSEGAFLYRSLGFQVVDRLMVWTKRIGPPALDAQP
jgi:ribosomal protein S18 acetylase RimI-like enzyme